jgi:chaperonin GroES
MVKKNKDKAPVQPLGDRVLLRDLTAEEKERKLSSGLILPASVKDEKSGAKKALVIAVGPGKLLDSGERQPVGVKPGDTVLFSWGDDLELDDVKYHIVTETNILGIVN